MKRFMYVILIVFLSIVIFSTSVFAASAPGQNAQQHSDPSGYDSWSTSEKIGYWVVNGLNLIGATTGFGNSTSFDTAVGRVFTSSEFTEGYDSLGAFLAGNSSYNDTTMTWTFSDDAMAFINEVLDSMKEEVTYVDSYFAKSWDVPTSAFTNRNAYLMFTSLIQNNTTYAFRLVVNRGDATITFSDGTSKRITSGKRVWALPIPFAAVSSNYKLNQFQAVLYDETWANTLEPIEFVVVDSTSEAVLYYKKDDGYWHELTTAHEVETLDLTDVTSSYSGYDFNSWLGSSQRSFNSGISSTSVNLTFFSNFAGTIPCFKSIAAMKNGTASGLQGQYMPNYTGQPITQNTITQQEINDFSTNYNYYYGSDSGGSGSSGSGSGSGSSGGSWIDNIVSGLTNLGSGILTIFSKVFEIITEILEFFTETLADVIDIIPTGFTQFLGALFPFFPEEWITGFSLFLTLLLIGAAIKIFVK